ncbi:hypothetical protein DJ568_16970 [Mucilaginibacter hurinus]|uniref:Lipoprotein n=1 Tax=Mucilaginibacter hurinus TaxID=2201324 RepID=A0A367GL80_9SPHI|nr:hypothetical protein [Mucilaginibacter hurinus]RCH53596.1 hypothetical protein DJ568_16970 [Mucilaginibacter hurinus]
MRIFTVIILFLCICLTACKKDAVNTEYDNSFKAWQSFKKSSNNSYYYVTEFVSWTGFRSETKITVMNGTVVSREYESRIVEAREDTVIVQPIEKWREAADSIGKHDTGFEPVTLDVVYYKAKNEWLKVDKNKNRIHFENKNNGMISVCGYSPKNCADDCVRGVYITEIAASTAP